MGVSIQREPRREVAQHPRHGFHIHAILEGQCGKRMAEIMKPDLRQARPIQYPVQHMEHTSGSTEPENRCTSGASYMAYTAADEQRQAAFP